MNDKGTTQRALREARKLTREILRGSGIRAYLFGSRAARSCRPFSDIDIALDGRGKPVNARILADLREALEESNIPFRADVVDAAAATRALKKEILKTGIPWNA